MSSSFGKIFRVSTFGESHGGAVGVILDGCPPKLKIDINLIQNELDRRRPGQSDITTCLLYTSPSPRDGILSRMPSSA